MSSYTVRRGCSTAPDGWHHHVLRWTSVVHIDRVRSERIVDPCTHCGEVLPSGVLTGVALVPPGDETFWRDIGRPPDAEGEDAALDADLIRMGSDFQ